MRIANSRFLFKQNILFLLFQVSEFIPPSRLNSTSSPSFYTAYSNTTNIVNGSSTPTKVYASTSYSVTPIKSTNLNF